MSQQTEGIQVTRGELELIHAPCREASRAGMFSRYQMWVLATASLILPVQRLLIATLIAFDGPWTCRQLIAILRNAAEWREINCSVSGSWIQDDGVVQRRIISHFSVVCWRGLPHTSYGWSKEIEQLGIDYAAGNPQGSPHDDVISDLLMRGHHWSTFVLPPLLVLHLSGAVVMAAVSDITWCRQSKSGRGTIDACNGEISTHTDVTEVLFQAAAEGKFQFSQWMLDALKAAFRDCAGTGINLSNERARRRLLENLSRLSPDLPHAGVPGILLFGWVHDLMATGSARSKRPAITTLLNYLQVAGGPLLVGMSAAGDVLDMDVQGWVALYTAAQLACTDSQLRILNPALASFHRFLVTVADAEPIADGFFPGHMSLPATSLIWPSESEAAYETLLSKDLDERLKSQAIVIFELLMNTSLRRSEISTLRIQSLILAGEVVIVEVAPRQSHKSLKSAASRRQVVVESARACLALRDWKDRRHKEAGVAGDLLFGDPHHPEKLFNMGLTYSLLIHLLKSASGDRDVGWHSCRHTFASSRLVDALCDGQVHSVSGLTSLQKAMGHAQLQTTLKTYCHLYEIPLRMHLDQALAGAITSSHLQIWTGDSAATIRQRKKRSGLDGPAWIDMAFHGPSSSEVPDDMGAEGFADSAKTLSSAQPIGNSIRRVLNVLVDLQSGHDSHGVCLRNSITAEELRGVICPAICGMGNPDLDIETLVKACKELVDQFSFARLSQPRWQRVLDHLESASAHRARLLDDAWAKHGREEGLSVESSDEVVPILQLLARAGFMPSQVRLRICREEWAGPSIRSVLEQQNLIELAVSDSFGGHVQVERLKPRRGRPKAFVVPLTRPSEESPAASASVDAKSLRAVMFLNHILIAVRGHR
jgi:integrase